MARFASKADRDAIEAEMPWEARDVPVTLYERLTKTAEAFPDRPAMSFQMFSGPKDPAETLTWRQFHARVTQAANLFRSLGIGPDDTVAYLLPNCNETLFAFLGGAVAGKVNPINPLLDAEQIAGILRETGAKVLVTLRAFPKTDVPQKAAEAVAMAPNVETVLEVDLLRYLTPPKSWIVPLIRPKNPARHKARVLSFTRELARQPEKLAFEDVREDRIAALFHTGGTTGMPKVAQQKYSGLIYNGWLGQELLFTEKDTLICPLPLFHVFAAVVVVMASISSGAHVVFPTPAGYRGEGVFDNFWKLIERWKVSFVITVPTAIAALMQRPVDADVSTLQVAFSGSAPLPVELYHRFQKATGVTIVEGYGLTEATCLVSCNPPSGEKKIGSVGVPFPYTDVRILDCDEKGEVRREMGVDEVGEICVSNPGVIPGGTYTDPEKNIGLYAWGTHLRTGDLGRLDADGYLWITGRAKDLIIRGGHNIDPAEIEEALLSHEAVAFAGAIGQPDAFAGELPAVYVELVEGAQVSEAELMEHAKKHIHERAAHPKYLEILPELPKTAVGKVFKPALRKLAITRVYNEALTKAGIAAEVFEVVEDKRRGLVARLRRTGEVDEAEVEKVLGEYTRPWEWAD
ncbi:fatty-acyl-CoA synthase/long-chain acyl-CoA synthetase [Meinhardsimonia xiamenensis]|uniref:Fatty-acyl-CoA synthase/long-chain acyl-CoA synthetase n=1 Tax=Meinhardsimonia xiamenensis TaxID=990712 RepID=A0A1G8Z4Y5_9RHOB|nr:acyl-CoA synthetase [Meinhardsimonia xiamenensis]PRX37558.1 fatty-acyl-CoA synthase/long-chain acyl-CoA synthetase [Meinhardsimonia xiamenensis]SDK10161.1 fatty-acyl-CoA synthase/long-chain acyl-CoA synthetase [Meinhardsimonia xiamenensis]